MQTGTTLTAAILVLSGAFGGLYMCTRLHATAERPQTNVIRVQANDNDGEDAAVFKTDRWHPVR